MRAYASLHVSQSTGSITLSCLVRTAKRRRRQECRRIHSLRRWARGLQSHVRQSSAASMCLTVISNLLVPSLASYESVEQLATVRPLAGSRLRKSRCRCHVPKTSGWAVELWVLRSAERRKWKAVARGPKLAFAGERCC